MNVLPFGIAVSKLDRLAISSKVIKAASSNSIYHNSASSNDNIVLMHWDSIMAETMCSNFAFDIAHTFTATLLLVTANVTTLPTF